MPGASGTVSVLFGNSIAVWREGEFRLARNVVLVMCVTPA